MSWARSALGPKACSWCKQIDRKGGIRLQKIAVLVSGGGTNLQALLDAEAAGTIRNGKIVRVISSKPGVYALERAARSGVSTSAAS